ncbi:hypothetical protein B0I35DRAFT_476440 [Stachybotrys elegans]|uniref:Uncharacterized protein n=1 Tax=Stachybotrys elegans TaxID=80388 RepID=A0A8K0SV69_9HYPO|nr:hypothetical protein B0I35DRAFT_476440 [Stachybotrys elegans]
MSPVTGKLVGDIKWLVAREPEQPGTIMRLGSILSDPEDLESSLNLHSIPDIPDRNRRNVSVAVQRTIKAELEQENSAFLKAVPSLPVFSAGASADGHWNHSATTTVEAMNVRAVVFIPDDEFMREALEDANVIKYARGAPFGRSLYVIVGTATASKLSVQETQSRAWGAGASANLSVPAVADAEAGVSHERVNGAESGLDVGEECDFAYRVRQFYYSKIFGLCGGRNRTKKALFGEDRGAQPTGPLEEPLPQFDHFKDEDAVGERSVSVIMSIPDEEEEDLDSDE